MKVVKVTKKINHDSMWMKFLLSDNQTVKLRITRRVEEVSHTSGAKDFALKVWNLFNKYKKTMSFGETFDRLEKELS